MTASAALVSLVTLAFGSSAPFRIAVGEPVSLLAAVGPVGALLVIAPWLAALGFSLPAEKRRAYAIARGTCASVASLALVWFSGFAAQRILEDAAPLARYSLGPGFWSATFFAVALLIASRREMGATSIAALVITAAAPLGVFAMVVSGHLSLLGMAAEYRNIASRFWLWTGQHLLYSAVAMGIAIVIGVIVGIAAHSYPRLSHTLLGTTSVFQTIPGLAMVGILAVPLGMVSTNVPVLRNLGVGVLGWAPVVVALTLYALLAVVRNTFAGLGSVPEATVEAGRGMGMSGAQLLLKVQLPLSASVILSGIRTATQQTIGTATLGVFVAAGTLGRPIFGGVSQTADDLVLLGSVALVVLALSVDVVMRLLQRLATPRHLRSARR